MPVTKLTELTLAQVKELQAGGPNVRWIFAAGRYQGIPGTLRGFTNNGNETAKFDRVVQDEFALWLIRQRAPLQKYIFNEPAQVSEDELLTQAMLATAQIWASFPVRKATTKTVDGVTITIPAGNCYYGGEGANTSKPTFGATGLEAVAITEQVLRRCRSERNVAPFLDLLGRAEVGTTDSMGYDVVNAGENPAGKIHPLPGSEQYLNRLNRVSRNGSVTNTPNGVRVVIPAGLNIRANIGDLGSVAGNAGTPTSTPTVPGREDVTTAYIQKTYLNTLSEKGVSDIWPQLKIDNNVTFEQFVKNPTNVIAGEPDLAGEIYLLTGISSGLSERAGEVSTVMGRLQGFTPAEQYLLLSAKLFEFFPDDMRSKMAANAGSGLINTTPHAWRAPGKVAITANITIPGASGFRIGEVFWIGRTYENFKNFGVFQLFGLTETIDVNRGWTTQLYSRFNTIPQPIIQNKPSI